jgi:glycosyltransferase involved in cell wall biosynthesis
MRILYFSRTYTTHDHRFLSTISGAGHEVIYLRLENGSQGVEDRPVPAAVQQVQWAGGHAPFRWSAVPRLAWDLKRVIGEHKPDLVHAGPVQSCAFISALTGFHPLITMSWGYDLVQDVHRGRWWEWVTRYTLERSDLFISDARVTLEKALAYGMDASHTSVFPWGIDLQHFSPAAARSPGNSNLVLFCNRAWEPLYGVDVVARAFTQVAPRHPGLSLILLGSGSQAANLRQILDGAGLMDRVHFGGKVSQAGLPYWYHQADLYISASHVDGSSVSLMEAMACGLPVLVSDIPGNREWVTNDQNGWLFKDGDPGDLAARIEHALEQRASLPERGRRSRKIAEERADWNRNSAILLQAYESVVSSKPRPRVQTVR